MMLIKRCAGFIHTFRRGHSHKIRKTLEYLWRAYSKPTPEAAKEVMTVLFLCSAIAVVTGAFFFRWMSQMLKYDQPSSATTASLYSVLAFFLLSLVHPIRCTFTIILPTLGTKQGRKLILSTAIMLLALNVIPNIVSNVAVVAQVLKCTAGGLAQSLINSSDLINRAKGELVKEAMKASLDIAPRLREFDHDTMINVSEVKQREGESWLLDTPSTSIYISINYKVLSYSPISCIFISACRDTEVVNFQQVYTWNFSFGSEHCVLEPSEPNTGG
ncbi:hypothetical protein AAFF_G00090740 [Aldrovandia affinis]|uniref:Uncharacterized protein n=1 Tax=Aldrovandia affinis TaxID=143900 RepID=A0AAD7WBT1_9TELE|nr:hypothetical protein AAFF_G00090740 [Aldrovandia affinis]